MHLFLITCIRYLDILAQSFDHTIYHIDLLHNALLEVITSVKDQKMVMTNHEVFVKHDITHLQESLLSISIDILYAQMKSRVAHYRSVFPSENKTQLQAFEKMVKLWRYLLQLENFLKFLLFNEVHCLDRKTFHFPQWLRIV